MSVQSKTYKDFVWKDFLDPTAAELQEATAGMPVDVNLLEDTLEHGHLPKIEVFDQYTFLIFRAYAHNSKEKVTSVGELSNKIAFFVSDNQLLTIHRADFSFLKNYTKRSYQHPQELVIDLVNDMLISYEKPLNEQQDKIDSLEKNVFLGQQKQLSIEGLYYLKTRSRIFKKILQLSQMVLNQYKVRPQHHSALQDLKDTALALSYQADEIIEDGQTILNSYLSLTTQRSNDVMKLLTVLSAFFLPLTFIVGLYGMNFSNMPELSHPHGYYYVLGAMVLISVAIFYWFKRKNIL
jgi:magnesium transporter